MLNAVYSCHSSMASQSLSEVIITGQSLWLLSQVFGWGGVSFTQAMATNAGAASGDAVGDLYYVSCPFFATWHSFALTWVHPRRVQVWWLQQWKWMEWGPGLFMLQTSSRKVSLCRVLTLSCRICSLKNSGKSPYGSPVRASYGVSIVVS